MDNTDASIKSAPLPTAKTLKARQSLLVQIGRFTAINFKMFKIIRMERQP
jgi:hypothetical protein